MRIRCLIVFGIHKYSINFCVRPFIIALLYNFLVIYFAWYKEYMTCLIWFSKFLDVLPAFTYVRDIDNLWSIYLGVHIVSPSPYFVLHVASHTILE